MWALLPVACVLSAAMTTAASAEVVSKLRMRKLGSSSLLVTEACLGTMTWGVQNSEEVRGWQAHARLQEAVARSVLHAPVFRPCALHAVLSSPVRIYCVPSAHIAGGAPAARLRHQGAWRQLRRHRRALSGACHRSALACRYNGGIVRRRRPWPVRRRACTWGGRQRWQSDRLRRRGFDSRLDSIGTWLAANPEWRSKVVLATKVCGYMADSAVAGARTDPATDPPPDCRLDRAGVRTACEASLRRMQTEYIDLYQLHVCRHRSKLDPCPPPGDSTGCPPHVPRWCCVRSRAVQWPDRYVPLFGQTAYDYSREREAVHIEETAAALKELLDEGKIRAYGLSNETPFGVCEWVRVAAKLGMPPPATIQNAYSLLSRSFESGLAEACSPRHHNVGLLPWSILCGGLLTGKYRPGAPSAAATSSRFVAFESYMSRWHPKHASAATLEAVDSYCEIGARLGLSSTALAILWCRTRPFIAHGAVIIGGTTVEQLGANIDAFLMPTELLTPEIVSEIDAVHMRCRDPSDSL